MSEPINPLTSLMKASRRRSELAAKFYEMLQRRGQLRSHVVVTYRCQHRCLLAQVLSTPQGLIVHVPRYKLSPDLNETNSVESARKKRTEDGNRRWKAQTFMLADALNVGVQCDHLLPRAIEKSRIEQDVNARHAEVVVTATN
ncbi:MAG: hypothetical protein LKJ18_03935 [Ancrocorticia sp.]|jgi:hypothetical protein|nr:hypothetical protein [Ancrocorticia sp.]MCI2003089.1 hypothetical protein [Ancrocorticia sp.]